MKIICPNVNCRYTGRSKRVGRASLVAFLGLCFLSTMFIVVFWPLALVFFVITAVYTLTTGSAVDHLCPRCSVKVR